MKRSQKFIIIGLFISLGYYFGSWLGDQVAKMETQIASHVIEYNEISKRKDA